MSFPVHISWTLKDPLPERASPLTLAKLNAFVAALSAVLITNTCVPFDDRPTKYSGVLVVGAEAVGVKGAAGVPMTGS